MIPAGNGVGGKMSVGAGEPSPDVTPDDADPGDETQRNFRYQHAYGVILLVAGSQGSLPYASIWCEHHEDFLAERQDGLYDAYQVKTATPEDGPWTWSRDGLRDSIRRFVLLDKKFPGRVGWFSFVSNVKCLDSRARVQRSRSPFRLAEAVRAGRKLDPALRKAFDGLRTHCGCRAAELRRVIARLRCLQGPGRDSFEDEVAHSHLSLADPCRSMTATQRNRCLDELLQIVHRASSLAVRDPSRHWCAISAGDKDDPHLRLKRVSVAAVRDLLAEMRSCPFSYGTTAGPLRLGDRHGNLSVLEQKLLMGGLAEYVDLVRDRTIAAERHLLELAARSPDEIEAIEGQVTAVVAGECDEARLVASQQAEPYGQRMLADVHKRLRSVVEQRPEMVYRQQYDLLAGVAGLLTESCRVWWSSRFEPKEHG